MNNIDFHASLHNLTQMDRHQHDLTRLPLAHQEQNAEIARDDAAKRTDMPVEPDEAEGKNVDPEDRRHERRNSRRRSGAKERKKQRRKRDGGSTGYFVDIDV